MYDTHQIHREALAADEEFSRAIIAQFGRGASRWDHTRAEYDDDTRAAYERKLLADATAAGTPPTR